MLDQRRVAAALAAKRDLFGSYDEAQGTLLDAYRRRWAAAAQLERQEVDTRLAAAPVAAPGARPTAEHDRWHAPVVAFAERWQNHEQARAWARSVLAGVPTFAVDGSQIAPSRDFYPPVGAVQIGWFENPHRAAARYVKDVSFEVLAPHELGEGDDQEEAGYPNEAVNWRRFEGECRRLIDYMRSSRGRAPAPVCFFDGSLIVSFAQHMPTEHQARYVGVVAELLETSSECRVPLVGYVDTSYAADLASMLDALAGGQRLGMVADSAFLQPLMPHWGSRTPAWLCARNAPLKAPEGRYYEQVGFIYLKTTAANPPARVEFPRWLLEEERLEQVVDVVRAECVVGNGYPYAAETADAVAVITLQDRERFYSALQRFAQHERLPLRFSRKAGSKLGRR